MTIMPTPTNHTSSPGDGSIGFSIGDGAFSLPSQTGGTGLVTGRCSLAVSVDAGRGTGRANGRECILNILASQCLPVLIRIAVRRGFRAGFGRDVPDQDGG